MKKGKDVLRISLIGFLLILVAVFMATSSYASSITEPATPKYDHFLNSPSVNIYWSGKKQGSRLLISGSFENNYYADLIGVHLYVDLLDENGRILQRKTYYFVEIEPDQSIPFKFDSGYANEARRIRFSFDYNYAEWRSSVSDYGILEDNLS